MSAKYFDQHIKQPIEEGGDIRITAVNAQEMTVRERYTAKIWIGTLRKMIEFKIIEESDDEAIIGNKDLCQLETIIDFKQKRIELGKGNWIPMRIQQKKRKLVHINQKHQDTTTKYGDYKSKSKEQKPE